MDKKYDEIISNLWYTIALIEDSDYSIANTDRLLSLTDRLMSIAETGTLRAEVINELNEGDDDEKD